MMPKRIRIRRYELGLYFRDGDFVRLLEPGVHWLPRLRSEIEVKVVSQRAPWLVHDKLDMIVKSGVLEGRADLVDLGDGERALVWIDGRFSHVLGPGLYAYWNDCRDVRIEIVDASVVRFEHKDLKVIVDSEMAARLLDVCEVQRNHVGVLFYNGRYIETLEPGLYAFWRKTRDAKVVEIDTRETMIDVGGQDIMTADKVTLRLNAVVAYRIVDAVKVVTKADDPRQALYRETQLALRASVGARDLDTLLGDKDGLASEVEEQVRERASTLGLDVVTVGIRDVILPGEMKDLMNKVTEAKKAAEANLIARREETAAMRSQANTAKLLESNATLMRIRELEVLEKIAAKSDLKVVLGEKGLAERLVNLL